LKGLKTFAQDFSAARLIAVSLDPFDRKTDSGIEIMNVHRFFAALWDNKII
jgi:hypothetical protein